MTRDQKWIVSAGTAAVCAPYLAIIHPLAGVGAISLGLICAVMALVTSRKASS